MKTRLIILSLSGLLSWQNGIWSQAAFVLPSPTPSDEPITLYIDLNQTNGGLKTILANHPEMQDQVYIWSWMPAEPVGGNGSWGDSNEDRKLVHEGNLIYSWTFTPTQAYAVDGPTFFANGISCLAKLDNGNAFPDDGAGEAKTEDLKVSIIPKLCDAIYCNFPLLGKQEDFLSITYDNNQETNPNLMNLGEDECYLYLIAVYDEFGFSFLNYASQSETTTLPEMQLKPVQGQPGFFRITIIPEEMFPPEQGTIMYIKYMVLKPGYVVTGQPVLETYTFLNCTE
jgi:hypothetical protein